MPVLDQLEFPILDPLFSDECSALCEDSSIILPQDIILRKMQAAKVLGIEVITNSSRANILRSKTIFVVGVKNINLQDPFHPQMWSSKSCIQT